MENLRQLRALLAHYGLVVLVARRLKISQAEVSSYLTRKRLMNDEVKSKINVLCKEVGIR